MRNTRHPNRIAAMPKGEKHWRFNPNPTVLTMHRRLHRNFGKASDHACVDCGAPAKDWSLEGEIYTDNIEDYRPRCRSCHVKYDMTEERKNKISNGLKLAYQEGKR
jgi:hypothetical protein